VALHDDAPTLHDDLGYSAATTGFAERLATVAFRPGLAAALQ
jgi:hypothetical protein